MKSIRSGDNDISFQGGQTHTHNSHTQTHRSRNRDITTHRDRESLTLKGSEKGCQDRQIERDIGYHEKDTSTQPILSSTYETQTMSERDPHRHTPTHRNPQCNK